MFSFDETTRKSELLESFYKRLASLGSAFTSRLEGGGIFTLISAFVAMVSDAWTNLLVLLDVYDPNTTKVDASLAFFERPRLQAAACSMTFTLFRADATADVTVAAGATIQTVMDVYGRTRSYKLVTGFVIPSGTYYATGRFTATETGLATTLTTPQVMEAVSGVAGLQVVAGAWKGVDNPFGGTVPTMSTWVPANASSFSMIWAVQGRDLEDFDAWRVRCFDRWDEQSTGSTSDAYESWAMSYVSSDGDSPVSVAKVTQNQVFDSANSVAPPQRIAITNGQRYIMGVELAVALRSGGIPSDDLLLEIGASILPLIPHTDVLWLRKPNRVDLLAGAVAVSFRGTASYKAQAEKVARSFFLYDADYPNNIKSLGATIHMSDVIYAIKAIDPVAIDDVKVVFTVAGKIVSGDIVLEAFDQLVLGSGATPETAIVVTVDPVV